jgi:hypothetical protein
MDHLLIPVLTVQSYNLSYYQQMGEGSEGRLSEHSVHRCRTAAALQMRLLAKIIVSYGAILRSTVLFKENSRLAGNEPPHKRKRLWINLCTSLVGDIPLCLIIILKWNKIYTSYKVQNIAVYPLYIAVYPLYIAVYPIYTLTISIIILIF